MEINKLNLNKNYFGKLFLILLISIFFLDICFGGLSVVLNSQNPDPVSPGNFVYVNVKISNVDDDDIGDVTLKFLENKNFKLAAGEKAIKKVGLIPAYSGNSASTSYYIGKFKLEVSDDAPFGLNTVSFIVTQGNQEFKSDFEILVQEINPTITISDVNINTLEAGKTETLTIELKNENSISLKDVVLTLDLLNVENKVLNTISGSNKFVLGDLKPQESKKLSFDLVVSPDAESKPVILPIIVDYEDALNNEYSEDFSTSVKVYSKPELSFVLDSQEIFTKGKGKITFAVANPGTSTIKGVNIEILSNDDYDVLEGAFQYVGNLNPDDFQTIQSEVFINNDKKTSLFVKLTYSDSYNVKKEEVIEIPLKIYSQEDLVRLNLKASKSSFSDYLSLVFYLIVGIVCFWFGKKRGYNKAKAKK